MKELPAPLVPAQVDLREFAFMPLDVRRLRDSRIAASVTGEAFRAAVLLWCASWHQQPAGSLPDDDVELAQLAGFGRVVREWKKVRSGALYGFVLCSDGRLYHPVVAEKANESWRSKMEHAWRKECDRLRKENKKLEEQKLPALGIPTLDEWNSIHVLTGIPADSLPLSGGIPAETPLKGEVRDREHNGQGEGENKSKDQKQSSGTLARKAAAMAAELRRLQVNIGSQNPTLLRWIADGFTTEQLVAVVEQARMRPGKANALLQPKYLDAILRDESKQHTPAWWDSETGIIDKAKQLGLNAHAGEEMPAFKERIFAAVAARKRTPTGATA